MNSPSLDAIMSVVGELDFDLDELRAKYALERDKRVSREGQGRHVPSEGRFAHFDKDPWVSSEFARAPVNDHTEVIIVGGGFGGLLAGARLREAGFSDIRIVEEAGDFGGTWYWNRYPGASSDIEAHIYMPLLEELQYAPRHRYSFAKEMLELSKRIGHHYDLYRKACFRTAITSAQWLEEKRLWLVKTNLGDRMSAKFLLLACGRQSLPKLPAIPGITTFGGHAFHTSRWDYKYTGGSNEGELTGLSVKRVAIIGTGATAIQVIPEVARYAKHLYVFQRTPSSVGIRANCDTGPDWVDMATPGWQDARRVNFQAHMSGLRPDVDYVQDSWTEHQQILTPYSKSEIAKRIGRAPTPEELELIAEICDHKLMNILRARVDSIVTNPETASLLKPWYRRACKRRCFHDSYLQAFNQPNVSLIDTSGKGVERITQRGIVASGVEHEVDCIIFATGFEAGIAYTRLTGFDLVGRNGISLNQHWKAGIRTLHGIMTDHFPNCLLLGANQHSATATNHSHLLDEQAKHIAHILSHARSLSATEVEPTSLAVEKYTALIKASPTSAALVKFYSQCTPGYYNSEGQVTKAEDIFFGARFGDGPLAFFQLLADWRAAGDFAGLAFRSLSGPTRRQEVLADTLSKEST